MLAQQQQQQRSCREDATDVTQPGWKRYGQNNPLHSEEMRQPHSQGICVYNNGQDTSLSGNLGNLVEVETVTLRGKTLLHGVKHRGETFYKGVMTIESRC